MNPSANLTIIVIVCVGMAGPLAAVRPKRNRPLVPQPAVITAIEAQTEHLLLKWKRARWRAELVCSPGEHCIWRNGGFARLHEFKVGELIVMLHPKDPGRRIAYIICDLPSYAAYFFGKSHRCNLRGYDVAYRHIQVLARSELAGGIPEQLAYTERTQFWIGRRRVHAEDALTSLPSEADLTVVYEGDSPRVSAVFDQDSWLTYANSVMPQVKRALGI